MIPRSGGRTTRRAKKNGDWWKNDQGNGSGGWKRGADQHEEEPHSKAAATGRPSHEVRDIVASGNGQSLKVTELKTFCEEYGLDTTGQKSDLIARVEKAIQDG